ncbi:MAG: hypothetical protein COA45_10655 [Zetaproteobacteria bacterium]|nr:MAG: hypothetical protein COA45_10655 [Zetaproteobacteria bacterium]
MIPSSNIAHMYVKIIGEQSLLAMAQSNLLSNAERIGKIRTHTFLAHNGQTEFGISRNFGCDRYYSWEDTIIDCRNSPSIVDSDTLQDFCESLASGSRFESFKNDIENRMDNLIKVTPFHSVLRGEDNMRYNIKRAAKVEDFDIIRVSLHLHASCEQDFQRGLDCLRDWENPYKIKSYAGHALSS